MVNFHPEIVWVLLEAPGIFLGVDFCPHLIILISWNLSSFIHAVQYCSTACGFPYKGPLVVNNNIINEMKFDTCWFAAQVMNPAKIFIILTTRLVTLACGCNLRNTKVAGICCLLLSYRRPLFIVDILQH